MAGSIDLSGIEDQVNWDELFSLPKDYWVADAKETREYLEREVGEDLPEAIHRELEAQEERIRNM